METRRNQKENNPNEEVPKAQDPLMEEEQASTQENPYAGWAEIVWM